MKRICVFVLIAIKLLLFSACLDAVQPESYSYVFAIGIDKGKAKKYNYSLMVQTVGKKSDSSMAGSSEIFSAEGDTLFEAIDVIHSVMSGEVNFMRTSVIIFGSEVAKSGGAEDFSKVSFNSLRMRQSVKLLVAQGEALEFMKNLESQYSENLTRLQVDLVTDNRMGIVPITSFSIMSENVMGGRMDSVLTLCNVAHGAKEGKDNAQNTSGVLRTGGMDSYIMGSALFDGWYMRGTIDENDTMYLLMARGQFKKGYMTYETKDKKIATLLIEKNANIERKVDMENKNVNLKVSLYCTVEFDETSSIREKWEENYKEEVEEIVRLQLLRIAALVKELNCDSLGIGRLVSTRFYKTDAWEKYDFNKQYKEFKTDFDVEVELKDKNIITHMD